MKRVLLLILISICSTVAFSQKQTAFWYFGEFAGLDFNSGTAISITDSQMTTIEGCATISNYDGELVMYTDGITVWNKNHEIMLNGQDLNGNYSSTNSAIIIPKPEDENHYYIFTVDHLAGANGLQYSEVDLLLDGGLGGIINSRKNVILHTPTSEKITAVKHQNDVDWWVLAHKWNSQDFTAYLVTSSGVQNPIITSIGTILNGSPDNSVGAMKFAPDGKQIAIANSFDNRQVQLFDFDNATGILSDEKTFGGFDGAATNVYGVEFSLDSKLLYATDYEGTIYQFNTDLATESDINDSRVIIANNVEGLGALQIAPNGKIYVARNQELYLGVIDKPNIIGEGSSYINNGMFLNGKKSSLGLPPFIQSYFWKEVITTYTCFGENTQFNIVDPEVSQVWYFDDPITGIANTSTLVNPTHTFSAPGTYAVEVNITNSLGETATTIITVVISEIPVASQATDYVECDDNLDGDAYNGKIQSFLLNTKDSEILGSLDPNIYDVDYFEDSGYSLKINKDLPYENRDNDSQIIFTKVYNLADGTCNDTTEFNLIVNETPKYELISEKVVCSNILPDIISVENPVGIYNYEWRLEDGTLFSTDQFIEITSIDFIPDDGATIRMTVTDPLNSCSTFTDIFIEKFQIATITSNDIDVVDLSDNNTITINPVDPNFKVEDYEFALDDGLGGIGPYQSEPYFENVAPGIRTIYIRDIYGCEQIEVEVSVIGFRKFFTPNNDGYNDTWHILGVNRNFYTASIIHIYDRYGKIVANILPQSDGWDGIYNNKKLPETDYWFTVDLIDDEGNIRSHSGHFSLIRR